MGVTASCGFAANTGKRELRSNGKIDLFYGIGAVIIALFCAFAFFASPIPTTSTQAISDIGPNTGNALQENHSSD
ncbi:hypothetical protein FHS77_000541 [Paenochrobactrum gallinarii]|uniref:Uncharacterized protein n=1 Tax=Paenochrobactrum gallinarii TaxID=643673 RepID=A0A841LPS4_9HYPH|nr:hypothetical protein [Paenochrobactrum gallinarii]MBB6260033.1 hypothetical protein [Paenochrobactrum gallinarii]